MFAIKGRISRFAAKAVEAVPTTGVDQTAVRFGRQLGLWYDHGGELYEKAVRIWESPIGAQARSELNDEWKQADQHHRNEARLLKDKASAARGTLSRIYGDELPEFAKPGRWHGKDRTGRKGSIIDTWAKPAKPAEMRSVCLISGGFGINIKDLQRVVRGRPARVTDTGELNMRNTLRTCLVGFLVLIMTVNPAVACHSCGGGWGGGYYYSGPAYYGGYGG